MNVYLDSAFNPLLREQVRILVLLGERFMGMITGWGGFLVQKNIIRGRGYIFFNKWPCNSNYLLKDFLQEGWRLENDDLADSESPFVIKGKYLPTH